MKVQQYFIIEKTKETVLDFSQGTVKFCKYSFAKYSLILIRIK